MSRGTRAILKLDALRHNLGVVQALAPASKVMAVVKANAYGHGLEPVVEALPDAGGYAVATLCEAERARGCSPNRPVLLLEGVTSLGELDAVQALDLDLVVHSDLQLELLEQWRGSGEPFRVWLKVDTGMHRLGFDQRRALSVLARLRDMSTVDPNPVLMSHLANADDASDPKTQRQLARFDELDAAMGLSVRSLANSAGVFAWPDSHYQWLRTGIALYGESPVQGRSADDLGLRPCMTLVSTLIAINPCQAGDSVGYGSAYRCPQDTCVGVVAIGYGDGYPRQVADGTAVLIGGRQFPLIGRVSMDMLTVDLGAAPEARVGDQVVLWGEGLPVAEVASSAGTIAYELMCGVTARVAAEYI